MTLIETAARAIYDAVRPEWDWEDPDAAPLRQFYRRAAQSVVEAIREPSETMLASGADIVATVTQDMEQDAYRDDARETWHKMIDALLEEG